jgi:hypothetical protein
MVLLGQYDVSGGSIHAGDIVSSTRHKDLWLVIELTALGVPMADNRFLGMRPQGTPRQVQPGELFVVVKSGSLDERVG